MIEGSYHNPDHSRCPSTQYYGVYVATGELSGISVRNNDCRACSKANANRTCAVVGGECECRRTGAQHRDLVSVALGSW